MPGPGFHWKWGLKHPRKAFREVLWFSRAEGIPLIQFPYTWYSLSTEGGRWIDRLVLRFGPRSMAMVADDRIMTRRYE